MIHIVYSQVCIEYKVLSVITWQFGKNYRTSGIFVNIFYHFKTHTIIYRNYVLIIAMFYLHA